MVAGCHLIWTAYGWWLPNDPRGSTSHVIRSPTHRGTGRIAPRPQVDPTGRTH